MKLSIIIPTRGTAKNIENSISRLRSQSFQDFECIFVVDSDQRETHMKDHGNFHFLMTTTPKNASALRNQGMHAARGEFLLFMDDDEWGDASYLEQNFSLWESLRGEIQHDFVLCPTLFWRMTATIQSQGFSSYNWLLSRPTPCILGDKDRAYIRSYSGNSLFGPASIMKQVQRNEQFDFVYEDIEYTYHLSSQAPIIVHKELILHHLERDKTQLEQAWIGSIYQAYRKAKHRCLFVRIHGKRYEKLLFFCFGFWGQPMRLMSKALMRGKKDRFTLLRAIFRGTWDGLFLSLT